MFDYRAQLVRVADGDSIVVECDTGFGGRQQEELRLLGVSAPEHTQPGGLQCRDFLIAWFAQCSPARRWNVLVNTVPNTTLEPSERRSFIRYLATVRDLTEPDRMLNEQLSRYLSQHPEWGHGI